MYVCVCKYLHCFFTAEKFANSVELYHKLHLSLVLHWDAIKEVGDISFMLSQSRWNEAIVLIIVGGKRYVEISRCLQTRNFSYKYLSYKSMQFYTESLWNEKPIDAELIVLTLRLLRGPSEETRFPLRANTERWFGTNGLSMTVREWIKIKCVHIAF